MENLDQSGVTDGKAPEVLPFKDDKQAEQERRLAEERQRLIDLAYKVGNGLPKYRLRGRRK